MPRTLGQSLIILTQNIAMASKLASIVYLLSLQHILYISISLFSKREMYHVSTLLRNTQWLSIANFLFKAKIL